MLRSVRDLQNLRATSAIGDRCGLVKDVYFDDRFWTIKYLVIALDPRKFGHKQVLASPHEVAFESGDSSLCLTVSNSVLRDLPRVESILPVCKQYARLSLGSPGGGAFARDLASADPRLRSARAVFHYQIFVADEPAGTLADLMFDASSFEIRHLAIEQVIDGRRVRFNALPQSVERFTWATQRVLLRDLQAVQPASEPVGSAGVLAA